VAEAFHGAGFGPKGDLWAAINGSRMLTQLRAPGSLQTRWLSEDVPYGLRTWAELGEHMGVAMPVARALVTLADAVMGTDSWQTGRSLADLGIAGMDRRALERYLATGRR
jgi:opine dehydrogenase